MITGMTMEHEELTDLNAALDVAHIEMVNRRSAWTLLQKRKEELDFITANWHGQSKEKLIQRMQLIAENYRSVKFQATVILS